MILNTLFTLFRALMYLTCIAFGARHLVKGFEPKTTRYGPKYNVTSGNVNGNINVMPRLDGINILSMITTLKFVFMDPVLWFISEIGFVVKAINKALTSRPEPKPPDPKEARSRLRRRKLKQAILTMLSMPDMVRAGQTVTSGLISFEDLKTIPTTQAELMRKSLQHSDDNDFLNHINGINAACDSGASNISTFDEEDFIPGTLDTTNQSQAMKGIAGGLAITGRGRVRYKVMDSHGVTQAIEAPGLLIKELPC